MARDKVLTIKVSSKEKSRIVEAAGHDKRTYSDWARLVLEEACTKSEMRWAGSTEPEDPQENLSEEIQAAAA